MSLYERDSEREYIYQNYISDLVLGRIRAIDVAARYKIPASTVRWWKHKFISKYPSSEMARIAAEQHLLWLR